MRKLPFKPYLTVALTLLFFLSLPLQFGEQLRAYTVVALAPTLNQLTTLAVSRQVGGDRATKENLGKDNRQPITAREKIERLEIENHLLKNEVSRLEDLLLQESLLSIAIPKGDNDLERHRHEIVALQQLYVQSIPGRVIFRSPDTWNSVVWLNVGEADNAKLGRKIIAKNSPVVVGTALVGVVDTVNQHSCRVRLITDSALNPSVRALRGAISHNALTDHLDALIAGLSFHKQFLDSPEKRHSIETALTELKAQLGNSTATLYLAKGELQGGSAPLWRHQGTTLHGIGFNLDFPDIEGPARDLRTGLPLEGTSDTTSLPILMVQDILVTTGMDGVFPAGLKVAEVTSIKTLHEGDFYYELEARPLAGNIQTLSLASILPPLGFAE